MKPIVRKYLSSIGRIGGKKSTPAKKKAAKNREARKAKKLIAQMAERRGADCKETGIVVKKRISELMETGKA